MEKYESIALQLPNDYVQACNGFALDIGCSTAKLIYRSKQDYENGEPKKDELKSDKGRVYLIPSIARTELDDVIELIRTKCDLVHHGDEKTKIMTTGAGCNLFKTRLEKGLNISLTNVMEFDCFIKAFHFLARTVPENELFHEPCKKAQEEAQAKNLKMSEAFGKLNSEDFGVDRDFSAAAPEPTKGPILPCVIGMCGSGVAFMEVTKDGDWKLISGTPLGGRMFLGLSALLTGQKDFSRIYAAIERGSFQSIDEYHHDLVSTGLDDEEGDSYAAKDIKDKPAMPFGKAVTRNRDQIKDDDILHSLYSVWLDNLIYVGVLMCVLNKVPNLYFCGNFVNNERARYWMTLECGTAGAWMSKGNPIRLEFINNGGHLGALGALMKAKKEEPNDKDKDKFATASN